ncbi:MAG: hypothetical protein ATN35_01075 [Epulopiscium sp. Nele67-Bin004]|nr:MAG: hypothetical protein ATN35_01075 [Epulopiscium sp. Nele67-Bin004]
MELSQNSELEIDDILEEVIPINYARPEVQNHTDYTTGKQVTTYDGHKTNPQYAEIFSIFNADPSKTLTNTHLTEFVKTQIPQFETHQISSEYAHGDIYVKTIINDKEQILFHGKSNHLRVTGRREDAKCKNTSLIDGDITKHKYETNSIQKVELILTSNAPDGHQISPVVITLDDIKQFRVITITEDFPAEEKQVLHRKTGEYHTVVREKHSELAVYYEVLLDLNNLNCPALLDELKFLS